MTLCIKVVTSSGDELNLLLDEGLGRSEYSEGSRKDGKKMDQGGDPQKVEVRTRALCGQNPGEIQAAVSPVLG